MSYKICALYDLKTSKIVLMRCLQVPIFLPVCEFKISGNPISGNPGGLIFKIFQGSMPPDPLKGAQKLFLAAAQLENFLG